MIGFNTSRPKRQILSVLLFMGALLPSTVLAEISPFQANYRVKYLKMHAADVSLSLEMDFDNWTMHRRSRAASGLARWLAGNKLKLDEQSWFKLEENYPTPTKFIQDKPGAKRGRRHIEIAFSGKDAIVTTDRGDETQYPASEGSQDQVSAVLAVMLQMAEQYKNFELPIMSRRGEDVAKFEVKELGTLKAAKQVFKTIHIVQSTSKRVTDYWLAVEHQMIPVKITHREKGDEPAEMLLRNFSIKK